MKDEDPLKNITDLVLSLEYKEDFFDTTVLGDPIWERLRSKLPRQILEEKNVLGQAHDTNETNDSIWVRYYNVIKSALLEGLKNNPYLINEHEILVYGHARRKQLEDGFWWDIYTDTIYENINLDYVHFETEFNGTHREPPKTPKVYHLDHVHNIAKILRKLGYGESPPAHEIEDVQRIEQKVYEKFGVELEISNDLGKRVRLEQAIKKCYDIYLKRIDPDVVMIVGGYIKEPFILACKERDVPVIELQHGIIENSHLAYNYPGSRTKKAFPDYLLVWGQFWKDIVEYPIPNERVIPVGFPYLEMRKSEYANAKSKDQILFVSNGPIGERLSKFAIEVANSPSISHDIVFKLHPGEYDRWRDEYPWLRDAAFEVIDGDGPPLYQLFAESTVQIGCASTALCEGLAFDLETYIYGYTNTYQSKPLLEDGHAIRILSVEDLRAGLKSNTPDFDEEMYFAPDPYEKIQRVLDSIIDDERREPNASEEVFAIQ